jgi:hypothetical protein
MKSASFAYPLINWEIYVAQRNTEPFIHMRGPIGWKAESHDTINERPTYKNTLGWRQELILTDTIHQAQWLEFTATTAIREMIEELFTIKEPKAINRFIEQNIKSQKRIGLVVDAVHCSFYIVECLSSNFNISQRELGGVKKLNEIPLDELYPLAKASLYQIKNEQEAWSEKFWSIPDIANIYPNLTKEKDRDKYEFTSLLYLMS